MAETKMLGDLAAVLGLSLGNNLAALAVRGVSCDTRHTAPGDLFIALKGQKSDGHDLAGEAVKKGAVAVLAERDVAVTVPVVKVPSTPAALSKISAAFFDHPSRALGVVGVTGTNGKTTITYMMESIFHAAGLSSGVLGTINYRWKDKVEDAANTTPQSLDVQRLLHRMKSDGVTHVVMEVSSHALSLHRVDDVAFAGAIFTNLTRDHLDFHKSMDSYYEAKAKLFDLLAASPTEGGRDKCGIINADDEWAPKLLARLRVKALTYGLKNKADVTAKNISLTAQGTSFLLSMPSAEAPLSLPLVGRHNVYNALAAAGAAFGLGLPMARIKQGLESLAGVPGRLERVSTPDMPPFSVFVDYAHTDDALRNVLETLRPLTKRRLISVFGCGGDRDKTKRPLMGLVSAKLSDHVVVTSDNPRSEDPKMILKDIEAGMKDNAQGRYEMIEDRKQAIDRAIRLAGPGDVVLLAGKGHETYQIFKDRTIHFDDREVAREALGRLR